MTWQGERLGCGEDSHEFCDSVSFVTFFITTTSFVQTQQLPRGLVSIDLLLIYNDKISYKFKTSGTSRLTHDLQE